jgi:hypothetical protein
MLRLWHIRWLPIALLTAAWPQYLQSGSLEKVWEVDLKKALQGEHLDPPRSFKVNKVLFSPNAQQIAVLMAGGTVLFRMQDSQAVPGPIQKDPWDFFTWSPDGLTIESAGRVVHLSDRKACELPPNAIFPKFIGNGSLIALFLDPNPLLPDGKVDISPPHTAHLRYYDPDCHEQDSWEVPPKWLIMDASPDRGLLVVSEATSSAWLIVDATAKKVLRRVSGSDAPRGLFADGGNAICNGNICWDVDTGKKIGEAPVLGAGIGVAARSSRVVLDDRRAARRRVWDFRSGKEVVSWPLKSLTYSISIDLDGFNRDRRSIPCAISPDGEYIVEGGDGKIWLYKIQR